MDYTGKAGLDRGILNRRSHGSLRERRCSPRSGCCCRTRCGRRSDCRCGSRTGGCCGAMTGYVRYLASNDQSSLSGSLPSNESGSVPSSLPSCSTLSRPSSFPDYSTGNLETNVWSFLERNQESSWLRLRPTPWACGLKLAAGRGPRGRQETHRMNPRRYSDSGMESTARVERASQKASIRSQDARPTVIPFAPLLGMTSSRRRRSCTLVEQRIRRVRSGIPTSPDSFASVVNPISAFGAWRD